MVVAFVYLDPNVLGGAVQATATGWLWNLGVAFRDATTNQKAAVTGVPVDVSDAQAATLAALGVALAAGVKAEGQRRGFAVTTVVLPQSVLVAV